MADGTTMPPDQGSEVRDLSLCHEPVSDFLALSGDSWPVTAAAVAKYSLSEEQLRQYERDGYLEGIRVLNQAQVELLLKELDEISKPTHPGRGLWHEYNQNEAPEESGMALFHSLGAWRISPAFHDLLFHPAYLVPARQLMGVDRVRFWHDQVFCKPAGNGSVVAWHQDFSYWTRVTPMCHLTVHLALDAQTAENGALQYIPGSHKWPLLPVTSRHFGDMDSIREALDSEQRAAFDGQRHQTALPAGRAAFHHPLSVHGSLGNRSGGPRRAAVVNLCGDGTRSTTDTPLLEGIPVVPPTRELTGQFFPLLIAPPVEPPQAK